MTDLVLDEQHTAWELRRAWMACKPVRLTLTERCIIGTVVGRVTAVSVTGSFATVDSWHVPVAEIRGIGRPTLEDAHAYGAIMRDLRAEVVDMTDRTDWSFEACQDRLRDATRIVLDAERDYDLAAQRAADAEAVYRRQLALKFKEHRDAGQAVEASLTIARSDTATLSRERDYSRDLVKLAAEKIENARDSRRSLWRLIAWATQRDARQPAPEPENAPAESWPR